MTDIDGAWQSIRARAGLHDIHIHDIRQNERTDMLPFIAQYRFSCPAGFPSVPAPLIQRQSRHVSTPLYLSSCFSRFEVKRLLGHFQDLCHSSAGCPLASPERVARRGSQWTGSARRRVLPFCGFRPFRTGRAKGSGATERPLRFEHLGGTSASVPGHDGCPVGSLRLERQYRDRKASWRLVGTKHSKECHGRS